MTPVGVGTEVEDGTVYLTDDERTYRHDDGIDDDENDMPASTSHIGL